jgi:AraC-like DNA-binding protein
LSNAEKIAILQQEAYDLPLLGQFRQSRFFGPGFHEEFRSFLFSFYWVAQFYLFMSWRSKNRNPDSQARVWRNWTMFFVVFQFCMFVPFYLNLFGFQTLPAYHITNSFVVVWLLSSSVSLFFFPSLLYGIAAKGATDTTIERKMPKVSGDIDPKLGEVMLSLVQKMDDGKLFLKQGYSINDFSRDTDTPVYQISKCLNHFSELGFVDFVNQKRIDYCVSKLQAGQWQNFTMEAIAAECGFSNRNSFTKAFKKFKGMTPSEFRFLATGSSIDTHML